MLLYVRLTEHRLHMKERMRWTIFNFRAETEPITGSGWQKKKMMCKQRKKIIEKKRKKTSTFE